MPILMLNECFTLMQANILLPSQQSFSFFGTGFPGLNQYYAGINVSCSRTQCSVTSEAPTCNPFYFVLFDSWHPSQPYSIMSGLVFLGWTSIKLGLMCLAQGHNTMTPVRLELATLQSQVKQSATALPYTDFYIRLSCCGSQIFLPGILQRSDEKMTIKW